MKKLYNFIYSKEMDVILFVSGIATVILSSICFKEDKRYKDMK